MTNKITATRATNYAYIVRTTSEGSSYSMQIVISEYQAGTCPQPLTPLDIALLNELGIKKS